MNKSTLKSKILPFVALCVVFFTTFFATYLSVRSVVRNSHATEDDPQTSLLENLEDEGEELSALSSEDGSEEENGEEDEADPVATAADEATGENGDTAEDSTPTVNTKKIKLVKQWEDNSDIGGYRPSSINIHIQRITNPGSTATLLTGRELNDKLKKLVNSSATYSSADTTITAIKKATALPDGFTEDSTHTISAPSSDNPIYAWLDGTTIYYYSPADTVYLNEDATASFANFQNLTDISGLASIDTSNTTTFHSVFQNDFSLTNVNALATWDTSNATNMWGMFNNAISLSDISGLATWDVSNATNVKFLFGANNAYIDTNTTPAKGMSLVDLTPLKYWNLASATSFEQMFKGNVKLTSLEGLDDWDTSGITSFSYIFESCISLTKEGAAHITGWTVPNDSTYLMFHALDSSIVPEFTGANSGGSASGGSGGSGSSSSGSYTEGGWTKNGDIWEKEIIINGDFTYSVYEDAVPLYASDASSLTPKIIDGSSSVVTIKNALQTRNITITKTWQDNNNAYNSRPSNITVHLTSTGKTPSLYQEVEYIEATGTQYINTGLTGNAEYTYQIDGLVRSNGNSTLINNYADNNNRFGIIIFNYSNSRLTCYWRSGGSGLGYTDPCISGSSVVFSQRFQMSQSRTGITITQNGTSYNYTSSSSSTLTGTNSAPIYLFHSDQSNASTYNNGVLYGAKIYDENGDVLRDFIPVYRKADGAIGMYDAVTGQFFTNAGTGTFIKGPDVGSGGNYSFVSTSNGWVKDDANNTWTYTFPVPDDGSEYQAYEDKVTGYIGSAYASDPVNVIDDAATITNSATTRTITLNKIWDDNDNRSSKRPDTVNARLFSINRDTGQFKTIANVNTWTPDATDSNLWTASITVASTDTIYLYEDSVTSYTSDATSARPILIDPATNTATITNTIIEQPREITITKQWEGDAGYETLRTPPPVHLISTATIPDPDDPTSTIPKYTFDAGSNWVINASNNTWTYTFSVPDDGTTYQVYEDAMDDYTTDTPYYSPITIDATNAATITNTAHTQPIVVTKQWFDLDSSNRPDNITVHLARAVNQDPLNPSLDPLTNPLVTYTDVATSGTWAKNQNGTWTYTFNVSIGENLGNLYVYENNVPGYASNATANSPLAITVNADANGNGEYGTATITNTETTYNLTLTNQVTGNLGRTDDAFSYTIKLYDSTDTLITGNIPATVNSTATTLTFGTNGYSGTFYHGDTIVLHNLPSGYSYTIIEGDTDYTESYKVIAEDGTTLKSLTPSLTANNKIEQSQTVTFINNFEKTGTGLADNFWAYLLLILLILMGFGGTRYAQIAYLRTRRYNSHTFISLD